VKIRAVSINPADRYLLRGRYILPRMTGVARLVSRRPDDASPA
jgi:NADPH:quinone reductase-like Zn-dependent oxidoreductase